MEFSLIIAGLAFMLNPMISILDIFPDFIGCALILIALNRLSAVSPELSDCRPYFKYLLYISVFRTLTVLGNPGFDDIMRLSISLLLGAGEFGLGIMAVRSLYDGIAYLNIRYGGKPKETPEFKYLGMIFFAVRTAFCIIPQIGALMTESEDELITSVDQQMTDWSSYTGLLTLLNVILTLICAFFWFSTVISYVGSLAKDKNFSGEISSAYEQKTKDDPGFFIRRTLTFSLTVFLSGAFFLLDLIGDGRNVIPDFIFAAFAIWALLLLSKYVDFTKKAVISGAVYLVTSILDFIYYDSYMKRRYFASFDFIIENFTSEYILAVVFTLISAASLVVFALNLYKPLEDLSHKYIVPEVPEEFVRSAKGNVDFIRHTVVLIKVFVITLILTALSSVTFTSVYMFFPEYRMIHLLVNVIFFVFSAILFSRMIGGVKRRYQRPEDD